MEASEHWSAVVNFRLWRFSEVAARVAHVRVRALSGHDADDATLPEAAGLGLSTVVDFERSRRQVSAEGISLIARALKIAGVDFIDENGGGAGVRLSKGRSKTIRKGG